MSAQPLCQWCQKVCPRHKAEPDCRYVKRKFCSPACSTASKNYERFRRLAVIDPIERYGYVVTESGCWEWSGRRNRGGYGVFTELGTGRDVLAHRYSYEKHTGERVGQLQVRHRCDNRPCINPEHLEPGVAAQNTHDMIERGRAPYGERHGMAKLTDEQVVEIRAALDGGAVGKELAARYGVTPTTISAIKRGRKWVS